MQRDFIFHNPTKIYFGKQALENLRKELDNYGQNVVLIYGMNSIKKIGLYDQVVQVLKDAGKSVSEISEVMPNPTIEKVYEGMDIAKKNHADLLLAVGGGSVIDYAKAVAGSTYCDSDPWEKYYIGGAEVDNKVIPVGCILTMVGTGSEMNDNGTITNHKTKQKIGFKFGIDAYPKFAIMNPELTFTVSDYQFSAGTFDIVSHILEQYFSNEDDNTSDYIAEGLLKSVINSSRIAKKNLKDYEARSNLMWASTWALNGLIEKGKDLDWEVHMMGQAIAAYTDATHGMTLSCISIPYYRFISQFCLSKFKRFAINVWNVNEEGKTDREIVDEGLKCMEDWMKELGLAMKISEVGIDESMIDEVAKNTPILKGGYHTMTVEEIAQIYRESL